MKPKCAVVTLFVVAALAGWAAPARAETFLTPFLGVTFGADATQHKPTYGLSLAYLGHAAGIEVEYANTPNFFGGGVGSNNVTTVMVRFVAGGNPHGTGVAPFLAVGAGLLRSHVETQNLLSNVHYNDFGLDVGAGVNAFFTPNVGLRADVRYFRQLQAPSANRIIPIAGRFDFWRGTIGVSFVF
jgi:Outer membrane protein beta-barrel domain